MSKRQVFDASGKAIDEEIILPDGKAVSVSMLMMDANTLHSISANLTDSQKSALADALNRQPPSLAAHRPGSAPLTDADRAAREKAFADRSASLSERWRDPPAVDAAQARKPAPTASQMSPADARDARLRDAWRT